LKVQGWMAQEADGQTIINTASDVGDLTIPVGGKDPASATTEVNLACNLDKRLGEIPPDAGPAETLQNTWTIDKTVYDNFGNTHTMRINFTKAVGAPNSWDAVVIMNPDENGADTANTLAEVGELNNETATFTVNFNNRGTLESVTDAQGDILTEGELQTQISFDVPDANLDEEGAVLRQTFNLNLGEVGSVVNSMTQFAEKSSTKAFSQDGYPMGYLESFKIDQSGIITGVYSNGTNRTIGQVALASFINPGGLEKAGESTYMVTNNSGDPNISESGIAGKGKFIAGALEMSNVDLAEQFTDMIVTQRGFQSNSKTIQTSDQMLQELLTLKR